MTLVSGTTYKFVIGSSDANPSNPGQPSGAGGNAGCGGGYSGVFTTSVSHANAVIMAGGGGGTGGNDGGTQGSGGAGGGATAQNGYSPDGTAGPASGAGGTQSAGGSAGSGPQAAGDGAALQGGAGGSRATSGSGGVAVDQDIMEEAAVVAKVLVETPEVVAVVVDRDIYIHPLFLTERLQQELVKQELKQVHTHHKFHQRLVKETIHLMSYLFLELQSGVQDV